MFTGNEDMEATALREQGWSISAIARHLGRDRKTVRDHLNGDPGGRRAPARRTRPLRAVRALFLRARFARTPTSGRPPCSTR